MLVGTVLFLVRGLMGLRWCVGLRVYGGLCGLFWVVWFRLVVLVFRFVFWGGV